MGNFDEVRRMEEIANAMDENPDLLAETTVKVEQADESAAVIDADAGDEEDLAGGLSDALDVDEEPRLTVDDLLGLGGEKAAEPDEGEAVESESAEPEKPQSGAEDRISELARELRELREQNDLLVKRALNGGAGADESQAEGEPDDEVNPDVEAYMRPIIRKMFGGRDPSEIVAENDKLRQATAPLVKQAEDRVFGEALSQYVEGFKPEMVSDLHAELETMSEQDKARFGNDFAGAVALAARHVARGAATGGKRKSSSPLANRHHSESSGPTPLPSAGMSEEEKLKRLMAMPNDEFLRIIGGETY